MWYFKWWMIDWWCSVYWWSTSSRCRYCILIVNIILSRAKINGGSFVFVHQCNTLLCRKKISLKKHQLVLCREPLFKTKRSSAIETNGKPMETFEKAIRTNGKQWKPQGNRWKTKEILWKLIGFQRIAKKIKKNSYGFHSKSKNFNDLSIRIPCDSLRIPKGSPRDP